MKILIALLLLTQVCFATEVNWEPYTRPYSEETPHLYVWSCEDTAEYDYFEILPHPKSNWVVETDRIYNTDTGEAWKLIKEE